MSQAMKSSPAAAVSPSALAAVRALFDAAADTAPVPEWPSSAEPAIEPMRASINTPSPRRRSASPAPQDITVITGKLFEMSKMMDVMMKELAEVKKELTAARTAPTAAARVDPMQQPDADAWAAYRISAASGQGVAPATPPGYPSAGAGAVVPLTASSGLGPIAAVGQFPASGGIGAIAPLRPIHPKDIEKPEKYDTVADGWLEWSKGFLNFLDRNDSPHNRWSALLKQVEAFKGRPITSQDEADWQNSLGIGNIADWKAQLEAYLSSYTKGRAREIVRNAGTSGALDAWRILADKGYSQRPIHQSARRAKAYAPRKNVNLKDLEMAIMRWETDVRLFEEACAPEVMSEPNKRMMLEDMCPDRLRDHLLDHGPAKFPDWDALRKGISDWTQRELERGAPTSRLAAVEEAPWSAGEGEESENDILETFTPEQREAMRAAGVLEPLLALVKKTMFSKKSAKGGKDGKGSRVRKCFECEAEDHIAANCPVRAARVAEGGPERLPKDEDVAMGGKAGKAGKGCKAGGKGGKGGKGPYMQYIPKTQWRNFTPYAGKGAGTAAALYPAAEEWAPDAQTWTPGDWYASIPGYALSMCVQKPPKVIDTSNRFAALQAPPFQDEENFPSLMPVPAACGPNLISPPSSALGVDSPAETPVGKFDKIKADQQKIRKRKWRKLCGAFACCSDCCVHTVADEIAELTKGEPGHVTCNGPEERLQSEDARKCNKAIPKLAVLIEKRVQSLKPLTQSEDWETIDVILDSGATVTVFPPHVGRGYDIQPSEASKAGVRYEVANGDEIPNLGEKVIPVMTLEGSYRGVRAQIADVSKALQSVRSLVRTGHVVIFGDGEPGNEQHYVLNKMTGEKNMVMDDGTNYLMKLFVVPNPEAGFGRQLEQP